MYRFSDDYSESDDVLIAEIAERDGQVDRPYTFEKLKYPHVYIPNRSTALMYSFKSEDSSEVNKLKADIESYNRYLSDLEAIPGFRSFFEEHRCCVSRLAVQKNWSDSVSNLVFSKKHYAFSTDLVIVDDYLLDKRYRADYFVSLGDIELTLPIGKSAEHYPTDMKDRVVIWNWADNGHDFCYSLWQMLGSRERKTYDEDYDGVIYNFDVYDQIRDTCVEPQLVRIFQKLERLKYIKTYTIKPVEYDPRWEVFGKTDGTVDVAVIDPSFKKNRLLMEQIEVLLWAESDTIECNLYFLTDSSNHQYLSDTPGVFGGHSRLKIYGKLDCRSAAKYIANGQYIRHRVFFKDEKTAREAGYRPCAKCMPAEYKEWKMNH